MLLHPASPQFTKARLIAGDARTHLRAKWLIIRLYAFRGAGGSFRLTGHSVSCAAVEDAQPVVVGVGVGESLAFDLFDDEVSALGRAVGEPGVEVGEDLCLPLAQGAREAVGLLDVIDGGPAVPVGELALGLAAAGAVRGGLAGPL